MAGLSEPAPRRPRPSTNGWPHFPDVFEKLRPPLRPTAGDIAHVRAALKGRNKSVLLLGVTPELSEVGDRLFAVDNSARMIAEIWPGDTDRCQAILADWTDLPFEDAIFDAVIGDGSLNSAAQQVEDVFREIRRVLLPRGKAIFRTFCSPDAPEKLPSIKQEVEAGWDGNIHAIKWRIAMAISSSMGDAIVPVRTILATFDEMFPDRAHLGSLTGWSADEISTLDAYDGADHSLGFPTLKGILDLASPFFSRAVVVRSAGYPLAERCPTIIWSAARSNAF